MIKQIGRIYRIWIILSGNKFEWFWKDLYDFARRALPHTPREAWFPFNPLNRSAGTCFIKTYPFGMIKLIQQIYGIYLNPHTGFYWWTKKTSKNICYILACFYLCFFQIVLGSFAPSTILMKFLGALPQAPSAVSRHLLSSCGRGATLSS